MSTSVRRLVATFLLLALCAGPVCAQTVPPAPPIHFKVVVVTMSAKIATTRPANSSSGWSAEHLD